METSDNSAGMKLAQLYKYFAQWSNPSIERQLPLSMVKAKGLYMQHKKKFDKLAVICSMYKIDPEKYFKFLVHQLGKGEHDAADVLLSRTCMSKYIDYLKVQSQYEKMYRWFWKSAKYIAEECIQLGMSSANEYFQHLVSEKLLAAKYMSGKLSMYYLCAIQNLKDIISKLDPISQAEMSTISDRYDKYRMDITEAFRLHKSCKLRPIELTDALIRKKTKERQQTANNSK